MNAATGQALGMPQFGQQQVGQQPQFFTTDQLGMGMHMGSNVNMGGQHGTSGTKGGGTE